MKKLYSKQVFSELPPGITSMIELKAFSSDKITLLHAKNVFSEQKGFPCYKFIVPQSDQHPLAVLEKKTFKFKKNHLFPINPDQAHGFTEQKEVEWYTPIFIEQDSVREISKTMFGTDHLFFENNNFQLTPKLAGLLHSFADEAQQQQPGYEFILQSLNTQIIVQFLRSVRNNITVDPKEFKPAEHKAIRKAIDFLHEHYQENFSLDELAQEVNYSPFHFIRIFKEETGKTPFEYFLDIKLEHAKRMLRYTTNSITEICFLCGFNNRSHFSTSFKRHVGVSPSQYRSTVKL